MSMHVYFNLQSDIIMVTYLSLLAILIAGTTAFQRYRRSSAYQPKPLKYISPDDSPRQFIQSGLFESKIGKALKIGWISFVVGGYAYAGGFSVFRYIPEVLEWWKISPDDGQEWNYFATSWNTIFWTTEVLGLIFVFMWQSAASRFMIVTNKLHKATHILVEEVGGADEESEEMSALGTFFNWVERMQSAMIIPVQNQHEAKDKILTVACVQYYFNKETDEYLPTGSESFTPAECHEQVKRGGLEKNEAQKKLNLCGPNRVEVEVPGIWASLFTEFFSKEYVVASVGVLSYMLVDTWNVATFWLLQNLGAGTYKSLFVMRPTLQNMHDLAKLEMQVNALRSGSWCNIPCQDLAVGDIISVSAGILPVDGYIVDGACVVDESALTGEPMPIQKLAVETSLNAEFTKCNFAYAGTLCMQSTGAKHNEALMIATSIGASTCRGALVRMVLFPSKLCWKIDMQMRKVYALLFGWIIVILLIHLSPLVNFGTLNGTLLFMASCIAFVISPMLPVSFTLGQTVSCKRLDENYSIKCLQPARIPLAGKVSTMVFDKTGTLTKDGMDFHAVTPVMQGAFCEEVTFKNPENDDVAAKFNQDVCNTAVPEVFRNALASAHTVTTLDDGTMVGNQVEVSMLSTINWKINGSEIVSPDGKDKVTVIRRLEFDHCRMTSGVVIRTKGMDVLDVIIKGSCEKVKHIADPSTTPRDYDSTTSKLARNGVYLLGVAHKRLVGVSEENLRQMSRAELEDGLHIVGLLHFLNEMKHDTPEAIRQLKAADIKSVICTGDNAHTGISIGRKCHIVDPKRVLLGDISKDGQTIEWEDFEADTDQYTNDGVLTGQTNDGQTAEWQHCGFKPLQLCDPHSAKYVNYDLAVTQGAWKRLFKHDRQELESIWKRLRVFGRMKPDDKVDVVIFFQKKGLIVGMCGDGGNDCGALRTAHAGLALSEAEASLVSPFSTGRDGKSLMAVVDLIRESRACLASNMASFAFFMVYSFSLSWLRTFQSIYATLSLGEYVYVTMDVFVGGLLIWATTISKSTDKLSSYRPTGDLFGIRNLLAIGVPCLVCVVMIVGGEMLLWSKSWYIRFGTLDHGMEAKDWTKRADNYDSPLHVLVLVLVCINAAYANSYGGGFRKNVIFNIWLNIIYLTLTTLCIYLLWAPPSPFHCIFRINCDNERSHQVTREKALTPFAVVSAGGVGGCFMGPQIRTWQEHDFDGPGKNHEIRKNWMEEFEERGCKPTAEQEADSMPAEVEKDSDCNGANNCFSKALKVELTVLWTCCLLVIHAFTYFVLNGPVADRIRRRKREKQTEIELAERRRPGAELLLSGCT